MKTDPRSNAYCHGNADFLKYGRNAGEPLYTKGLSPPCDILIINGLENKRNIRVVAV